MRWQMASGRTSSVTGFHKGMRQSAERCALSSEHYAEARADACQYSERKEQLNLLVPEARLELLLWATHYRFLNDYSEIVLFKTKLVSFLHAYAVKQYRKLIEQSPHLEQKISEAGGIGHVTQHDTEVLVNAQYHGTGDEICILSF